MSFVKKNTGDGSTEFRKTLLYTHHGWGKTTQMKYYQEHFGPGFIISGERGLSSIASAKIDYAEFSTFADFREIYAWILSDDFAKEGYKWIGLDSVTELSYLSKKAADAEAKRMAELTGKKLDGFAVWNDHASQLIGACKAIRDLPMHCIVTALAKDEDDDNGNNHHWPLVDGKSVMKQIPGIFDLVLCGVRVEEESPHTEEKRIVRKIITDEVNGWHGKVRDELRVLSPIEDTASVIDIIKKIEASTKA